MILCSCSPLLHRNGAKGAVLLFHGISFMVAHGQPSRLTVSGGHRRGVTPVPIPNTVVKPSSAHGTAVGTAVGESVAAGINLKRLHVLVICRRFYFRVCPRAGPFFNPCEKAEKQVYLICTFKRTYIESYIRGGIDDYFRDGRKAEFVLAREEILEGTRSDQDRFQRGQCRLDLGRRLRKPS